MICGMDELEHMGIKPQDARVVIQGFGNVGMWAARLFAQRGCKVVGISDVTGAYYNENGIDIDKACELAEKDRNLGAFRGGDKISNSELLVSDCDVLVPAALEKVLTAENAAQVKAKLVVEGANGPTTPEADRILNERAITVIPDIMANAGGVTVSYFEWVQDRMGYYWKLNEVNERLEDTLLTNFRELRLIAKHHGIPYRTASYMMGIDRVVQALKLRGIYA
jgi:glutamate dehydrogenase (NAD(P)+)